MAKSATKRKQVEEDDDLELEDLEEVDEDDDEDEAPRAKKGKSKGSATKPSKKSAKSEVTFGTKHLIELIAEETGKELTGRNLRVLLRKMARDGDLKRSVGEDRGNYSWSGPNDPEVKAIIKAIKSGAFERTKKENLENLKKGKKAAKAGKGKKVVRREADDDDDDEDEDDE